MSRPVIPHADPEPEHVLEVIRALDDVGAYIWLDRNGWLVFQPPGIGWRPPNDPDHPRRWGSRQPFKSPSKAMRAAQKIGPTLCVYLDVIRQRDGLAPHSPAADRIEELSYSLTAEWEIVLEELRDVESIFHRTDPGDTWIARWGPVIEETERAIARARRHATTVLSEDQ